MKLILIIYFIFVIAWMGCKEEKKYTTKPFTGKIGDSVYVDGYRVNKSNNYEKEEKRN